MTSINPSIYKFNHLKVSFKNLIINLNQIQGSNLSTRGPVHLDIFRPFASGVLVQTYRMRKGKVGETWEMKSGKIHLRKYDSL